MKTEAELREFYYDVIHPNHIEPLGEFYGHGSSSISNKSGLELLCTYVVNSDTWMISRTNCPWFSAKLYINSYRTDLSDADKLALILKYT